jgi:hypothetical protein
VPAQVSDSEGDSDSDADGSDGGDGKAKGKLRSRQKEAARRKAEQEIRHREVRIPVIPVLFLLCGVYMTWELVTASASVSSAFVFDVAELTNLYILRTTGSAGGRHASARA